MTIEIDLAIQPEIAQLIRGQIAALRRRHADAGDDGLWRLRLAASPDEETAERFEGLAGSTIRAQRMADLTALESELDAAAIDLETAHAWIRALNQLRLVTGTDLGVTDDDSWLPEPESESVGHAILYQLLTQLQGWLIEEVSQAEGL